MRNAFTVTYSQGLDPADQSSIQFSALRTNEGSIGIHREPNGQEETEKAYDCHSNKEALGGHDASSLRVLGVTLHRSASNGI